MLFLWFQRVKKSVIDTSITNDHLYINNLRNYRILGDLLSMDKHIDLIIPRGSSELVRSIQQQSQHIPVLGHAEGICHVFVDKDADLQKALKIIRDAKCDYPAGKYFLTFYTSEIHLVKLNTFIYITAACNAMETLLIHEELMNGSFFADVCNMFKREGVRLNSGPKLNQMLTFGPPLAKSMRQEYGALEATIEVVTGLDEAIEHIHKFGSSHTDVIITENGTISRK